MSRSEYHGKRGSNAGDDFHEIWALRRALETISPRSTVQKVTVEGVLPEDERQSEGPEWDGVDCAVYHGPSSDDINRIEIAQLKYSGADPTQPWTLARLTYSTGKARNNSVIARLAEAFSATRSLYPMLAKDGLIDVKLVSNQSGSDDIYRLSDASLKETEIQKVRTASGLGDAEFTDFQKALDFSELGSIGRHGLEEKIVTEIAGWDQIDSIEHVEKFRNFVRNRMKPEGQGAPITAESILSIFGSADPRSLFPCPSKIDQVDDLICREESEKIIELWQSGKQKVCLHGQGGEGKTTVIQDIADKLPQNSIVVAFDCYGAGSYLNSDTYRHKPQDAFLQLANEVCSSLLLPSLLTQNRDADYPRLFSRKIEQAATALAALDEEAVLVVAIDAADNAIIAADVAADNSISFIPAFLKLSAPPDNVRFLVSARSGRLDRLELPSAYEAIPLGGFSIPEARQFLSTRVPDQSDDWVAQVHGLSGGNPRVLQYATEAADGDAGRVLDYLSPSGQNLAGIFSEILDNAFKKVGSEDDVRRLCAALSLLPRPIPMACVATVSGLSEPHTRDILSDLAPGVMVDHSSVSFRDEDFEAHVREVGEPSRAAALEAAATHFIATADSDPYSAENAADILLKAERYSAVFELAKQDVSSYPIDDPAVRTLVHEKRMRAAIRTCRRSGDTGEAINLLLVGADAFRKDAAIRELLFENLDLAAHFSQDQMRQIFLSDPKQRPRHGSFLMHSMRVSATQNDKIEFRAQWRLLSAWLDNYSDEQQARRDNNFHDSEWKLEPYDVAAYLAGKIYIEGVEEGFKSLSRARPSAFRQRIFWRLVERLARSGDHDTLSKFLEHLPARYPGKGLSQIFLALAGEVFDLKALTYEVERSASAIPRLYSEAEHIYDDEGSALEALELIITAIEIALIHGASKSRMRKTLSALCTKEIRARTRFDGHPTVSDNLALRAFTLLRLLKKGADFEARDFVHVPAIRGRSKKAESKKREREEKIQKSAARISGVLDAYKIRANIILKNIDISCAPKSLRDAVKSNGESWRYSDDRFELRNRDHYLARSLIALLAFDNLEAKEVLKTAFSLFREYEFPARNAASQLLRFAQFVPRNTPIVIDKIREIFVSWRDEKIPSYDKMEVVTRYSRIALFQNLEVASEGFDQAIEIASEIDAESVHALAICEKLASHSKSQLDQTTALSLAQDLTAITRYVGERIGSNDGFPWHEIASCLSYLAVPQALATCARFNEIGLIDLETLLEPVILTSLEAGEMDERTAVALMAMLDSPSSRTLEKLSKKVFGSDNSCAESLAWDVMIRKPAAIGRVAKTLPRKIGHSDELKGALLSTAAFLDSIPDSDERSSAMGPPTQREKVETLDWSKISSVQDLENEIEDIVANAPERSYLSKDDVLSDALSGLPKHRRTEILDYVAESPSRFGLSYQFGGFLNRWLTEWSDSPPVGRWCRDNLLEVISDNLPDIARYLEMGQSHLRFLLEATGASDEKIVDAILEGIEQNIDHLHSALVYHLAAEIGLRTAAHQCASALNEHVNRRLERLPSNDRKMPNMDDVPNGNSAGIARFLFANLGNPIVPIRWRTAHTVRRLAKLGEAEILEELVGCYTAPPDHTFGHPEATPYFLSSKLWLLIAFARSAWETPAAIQAYKEWLFEIGESTTFPHVLVRAFAQLALRGLASSDTADMSDQEIERVSAINLPAKPRKKRPKDRSYSTFEKYGTDHTEGRKFQFDIMDTLPYQYDYAVRGFADPSGSEFLDRAEHWIVNEWGAPERGHEVDALRKDSNLWQKRGFSSLTSHGSRPSIESYRTYLEFHGMHCALGDFLITEPLASDSDDWDRFEHWLERQGLTSSPIWLSDLREPKPLERQFWREPSGDKTWLKKRAIDEIRSELFLDDPDWLVVAADHWASNNSLNCTVRIETCLVSSDMATSLRRALEASESSYNYRLAIGDEHQIDHGGFQLRSILRDQNTESGLDEHDRFRGELGPVPMAAMDWVLKTLNLEPCPSGRPIWLDDNGSVCMMDRSWSDEANYYDQTDFQYRVHGHRLMIRREKLAELLDETKLDLAVELTMRRSIGERYGQTGVEEETVEFDRIIIFRQNGKIESTGKRLGSWKTHRARAGTSRKQ